MNDKGFEALLRHIDERIEQPLSVASLATWAGYSAYHFSRMFTARMHTPVMEYVRTRRLAYAVAALLSGERIMDIAVRYCFGSHEGFTRAFRRVYQVTPTRFRALHAGPYAVPPPLIPTTWIGVKPMQVRFENRPEQRAIGYRLQTAPGSAEIPAFWNSVMADDRWARLLAKANGDNYGICIYPADMEEGKIDYMIAFDWDGVSRPDPDMAFFTIPAATYAVFDTREAAQAGDKPARIRDTWTYAYTRWFPGSGYQYDGDKPDFELYPDKDGCLVYIPVVKG